MLNAVEIEEAISAKAKFTLATDGTDFEAEDLTTGETVGG
jgi:hypothetical protein